MLIRPWLVAAPKAFVHGRFFDPSGHVLALMRRPVLLSELPGVSIADLHASGRCFTGVLTNVCARLGANVIVARAGW
jgi:hypothetical protein